MNGGFYRVIFMTSIALASMLIVSSCSIFDGEAESGTENILPRPKFNKAPYVGTLWCHANPWFFPNNSAKDGKGTDLAWHKYPEDPVLMWKKVAEVCALYGINGLQLEMIPRENGKMGYIQQLRDMLEGFKLARNGFKAMLFLSPKKYKGKNNPEIMKKAFLEVLPLIKNHPNAYRLNGSPVVPVYIPYTFTPEEWHSIIGEVEKACGRIIWLADIRNTFVRGNVPGGFKLWLKNYMKVFDGTTLYANWSLDKQREFVDEIAPLMKKEYPEKIFESGPHNTFTNHFYYEGMSPRLTEKFVGSWDMTLEANPDSITITNLFDTVENSRVLPSYELDDILLKISQYYISVWRKMPPPETEKLSIYVANYTNLTIGSEALFEVIGFPFKSADKSVSVQLDICDGKGKVLHSFPETKMLLDSMRILKFSLPTLPYADCRALFPRLKYKLNGKEHTASSYHPTTLVTNLRPHLLMWCRSIENMIELDTGSRDWTLNGAHGGETAVYPEDGIAVISSNSGSRKVDAGHVRLLRNGKEIDSFKNRTLMFNKSFRIPNPGDSIDCYNLELVSNKDEKYLSPPIWVSKKTRDSKCIVPVLLPDKKIVNAEVEEGRAPFFFYPCSQDCGALLLDRSGYEHNGILVACQPGAPVRQHLKRTGYRHEHTGNTRPLLPEGAPSMKKDNNGDGFLHFNGNGCAVIMGGTAFPYSFTYELFVKPEVLGKTQGLISSPSGQVNLELTSQGNVKAWRWRYSFIPLKGPGRKEYSEILSIEKLKIGEWAHIAVVYDLKKLYLYVNGQLQGETPAAPDPRHEWMNLVMLGSLCNYPWNPVDFFTGDIKRVRIYGRNLDKKEFLKY